MASSLTNWFKNKITFKNNSAPALNATTLNQMQANIEQDLISAFDGGAISSGMPVGSGCDFFGSTAPTNYMFADGSEISREEYPELFAIIGEIYGVGDGKTTFNLPDKRSRVTVAKDTGTFDTLGKTGGEETHILTIDEMPSHTHTQEKHRHLLGNNSSSAGSSNCMYKSSASGEISYSDYQTPKINETGGDLAHNNLQPYLVCNYIIKVK